MPIPSPRLLANYWASSLLLLVMLLALLASPIAARADQACCDKAQNQMQSGACAEADLKKADDQLNQTYKQMQERLKGDAATAKLLRDAQRKWLAFRDAECAFQVNRWSGGSIYPMQHNSCLADLTQARAKALREYLDCAQHASEQDGTSCPISKGK